MSCFVDLFLEQHRFALTRFKLFFEAGQLPVLQLSGFVQIVGALGLFDVELHLLDLRAQFALFLQTGS